VENILITGGCGFLGQHLTKQLLEKYPQAKIKLLDLFDNPQPIHSFKKDKRVTYGLGKNICNYDEIKNEFKDIDVVFHLAGIVSFWIKDKDKLFSVNVKGSKNVFQAAKNNKVKRFIHISSVAALGYNNKKHQAINEEFKFNWKIAQRYKKYYMLSKYLADKELIQNRKGINLNVVYPGLMLGPGDHNNSGKLLNSIKNGQIPFYTPGGTNLMDVRDVANGLIAVLENGKRDEDYLLSGYNLTFKKQFEIIAKVLKVNPPKRKLPLFSLRILYPLVLALEKRAKERPKLTSDNLHSSFKFRYFDNSKAQQQLNWKMEIPFHQTIQDTYNWMKSQ